MDRPILNGHRVLAYEAIVHAKDQLVTLETELETIQRSAVDLSFSLAATSAQALDVVANTVGHGARHTEKAFAAGDRRRCTLYFAPGA